MAEVGTATMFPHLARAVDVVVMCNSLYDNANYIDHLVAAARYILFSCLIVQFAAHFLGPDV